MMDRVDNYVFALVTNNKNMPLKNVALLLRCCLVFWKLNICKRNNKKGKTLFSYAFYSIPDICETSIHISFNASRDFFLC